MSEVKDFIQDRESRHNGKIDFLSYARYLGTAKNGHFINLSGVIYIINNVIYFEDFEKKANPLLTYGQDMVYNKTEFDFALNNIHSYRFVNEKDAKSVIMNKDGLVKIQDYRKGLLSFFDIKVVEIVLNNEIHFIDITKGEEFLNFISRG
ncbi:MAG: hypothetical protein JXR64_00335 [Spirochaetales bacterium]|nr:hypothetical protein [Spirochaetales bacterium]